MWKKLTGRDSASMMALADTGASKSVIVLALVKKHKLKIDPGKARVSLTNAFGDKMSINGMVTIFIQPEGVPMRKMVRAIVSESVGGDFLLRLPDLKPQKLTQEKSRQTPKTATLAWRQEQPRNWRLQKVSIQTTTITVRSCQRA